MNPGNRRLFTSEMRFLSPSLLSILLVLGRTLASHTASNHKENTTLLLVQALLRHGERAPLSIYKNDPNKADIWTGGLKQLTRFGKKHHYAIGKLLRSMYDGFLTTDPKEVCANSFAEDRCLRGAAVTLASLYEPEGIWKFEEDLKWQPIPVYYLPAYEDKYLNAYSPCPRGFEELARLRYSEEVQELTRKHQKMLEDVSNYTETDMSIRFRALNLYDTLLVEKTYHLTIPTLLDNCFEELQVFTEGLFKSIFGSDLIQRLRFGPLLGEISENMKRKINGDIPDLKFQLYSVQDVFVAAFLKILNFTNFPRPPYCAMLLFELHEMADATVAVRLLYQNSTGPLTDMGEPHVLVLDDCSEFCPLANFTKRFQRLIPEDLERECQLNSAATEINKSVLILVLIISIIVVICFLSLYIIYCIRKRQDEKELSGVTLNMAKNVT